MLTITGYADRIFDKELQLSGKHAGVSVVTMQRLKWWFVICQASVSLRLTLCIVGGDQAAKPESDSAVVFLQMHGRSSRVEGIKHSKFDVYSFFGIRYAESPEGSRRFQRPVRQYMAGDMLATQPCKPCPQLHPNKPNTVIGDENCLCINVFAPKMPGDEKGSAVIVFFHGGNYKTGSATYFGGAHFAANDTILVTVQYRLGALGFLSTGQKDASGNNGLFDMFMAKTWVTDYIEFFGGDPERIIYMGQGSGGSAASLLALADVGSGAQGVIALSGAPLSPGAVRKKDDPKRHAYQLAAILRCQPKPAEKLIACLRQKSVNEIILADSKISNHTMDTVQFLDEISGLSGAGARVEGPDDKRALPPLISEKPADSLKTKRRRCAFLTGVNSAETARAVYGKYSELLTHKLMTVKNFVQNELIGTLQGIVAGVEDLIPLEQAKQLDNMKRFYQQQSVDVLEGLTKIAEATGDALFNLPAYLSVKAWGQPDSPAFMFSFNHNGNLTKGAHFLPGVALAEENEVNTGVKVTGPSHGDELAYLFEALNEEGKPLPETVSSCDKRVRDNFLNLVTRFAHQSNGRNTSTNNFNIFDFPPFSQFNEQIISIGEEITLNKDFRFCQMGIWGGIGDRVSGTFCKNILEKLPKLKLEDITSLGNVPIDNIRSDLGNITPALKNIKHSAGSSVSTATDKENEIDNTDDSATNVITDKILKRNTTVKPKGLLDIPKTFRFVGR